ncbi:MAG TPA: ATP-binding protein [Planctomycetota bacterium]|jgi:PAS domain S-box-containing protein|nr:ATP-binding protein [Planctomycetota bacterium]
MGGGAISRGFEDFVLLARLACRAPAALLCAASDRAFRVLSAAGWPGPTRLERCGIADECLSAGRLLVADGGNGAGPCPPLRFLAAAPLLLTDGTRFGFLAVLDTAARDLEGEEREALAALARLAVARLEARRLLDRESRAESDLRKSREWLRAILDHEPECVKVVSPDGLLLDINPAGLSILEAERVEDVTGQPVLPLVHPEDREVFLNLHRASCEGRAGTLQFRMRGLKGTERWMETHSVPLRDAAGRIEAVLSVSRDVTERRRADDQLRKAQAQLAQAQKMEAIGRMAGGIAHDFNNILTVINGYSEMVLRQLGEIDPLHEPVWEILKAGRRAAALTSQLLAFSRRQVLSLRVVCLNDVVAETERMLRRLIGEHIELVTAPAPDLGPVRVDANQMVQVIMNLSLNARDAMPDGGTLRIATANVDLDERDAARPADAPSGPYVMLSVSDTGTGMSPEVLAQAFEPFFTTKASGQGTGLGLATVYGIVKQSGGYISVSSEVGRGTVFRIFLPRVDGPVEAPAPAGAPGPPDGEKGIVLVVEDDPSLRKLVRHILTLQGYEVLEAGRAEDAERIGREWRGRIDLLLTDMVLPGQGGCAVARALRRDRPELKIVYMSGYSEEMAMRQGLEPDARLLQKPFAPEALLGAVRGALRGG